MFCRGTKVEGGRPIRTLLTMVWARDGGSSTREGTGKGEKWSHLLWVLEVELLRHSCGLGVRKEGGQGWASVLAMGVWMMVILFAETGRSWGWSNFFVL